MKIAIYSPDHLSNKLRKIEMCNLPQELKLNIFSRLPVKILCRCKCVCKEWLSTVTDPYFLKLHQERSKENRQFLLMDQSAHDDNDNTRRQVVRFFSASMEGDIQFRVMGLVNGYIYMIPSGHGLVCLVKKGNFYVFNPSMKKAIKLPKARPSTCKGIDAGFGYIPSTNEYKLVHLYDQNEDEFAYTIKCEIFTISDVGNSSNSWRQVEKECPFMVRGWGVLANNKFYWMVWEGCHPSVDELIISLDLETETFEFVPHPYVTSYIEGNDMLLVEVQGHLCLIDSFACPPVTHVWMLKDEVNKVWAKQWTIDLTKLEGFDDELTQIFVLGYQNEEIVINSQKKRLDFFNIHSQVFRKGARPNLDWDSGVCLYTDTFFSLGE